MSESLTPGERAIWAAAFAARYRECALDKPDRIHPRDDAAWEEWELTCADNAAEWASFVVQRARESLPRVREGWGENSSVAVMLADVLGKS